MTPEESQDYEYGEAWDKAVGQFRMKLNVEILNPLRMYGQGVYVDSALNEIVHLAIQLHLKLQGLDFPYEIDKSRLHW